MKQVVYILAAVLLLSATASAATFIRIAAVEGRYYAGNYGDRWQSISKGWVVGATSYIDGLPLAVSASYGTMSADGYVKRMEEPPYEETYADENDSTLLRAFVGYKVPGTQFALGGGWVSLAHTVDGVLENKTEGAAIAVFTAGNVFPWLEFSGEFFYAPNLTLLGEAATGKGFDIAVTCYPLRPVGVVVGLSATNFVLYDIDVVYTADEQVYAGLKLRF